VARTGSFGTSTSPFGSGVLSDLGAYSIGAAPAQTGGITGGTPYDWNPPADYGAGWSATTNGDGTFTYTPPTRPTVAPEPGVMPEPVIPQPAIPPINYTQAAANVVAMQGYVNTLQNVANPTQAQQTALATDLAQLAKNQAAVPAAIAAAAANVAKMQSYVNTLQAVSNPTPAQRAALATDLAQLAKNQATLASLTGG